MNRIIMSLTLEGSELVVSNGQEQCRLPAGADPVARIPHVMRGLIGNDNEMRAAFELAMSLGLGCAGATITERENVGDHETAVWSDASGDPAGGTDGG